jgi:hypothetical protein
MSKPTLEQLADEEKRVTDLGFFNFADTYWYAALTLVKAKALGTHKESPVRFLYYHAIELYLKSYLLLKGIHPSVLRSKQFGHDIGKISRRAEQEGLQLMDEDKEIFAMMSDTDTVIRSRYLLTGPFRWPTIEALDRTCKSLRESIAAALKTAGRPVRSF